VLWMPFAADAQTPPVCQTTGPQIDNRDGYFVNLEEGPVAPPAFTANGSELWAVNLPDASVTVFSTAVPTSLTALATVKVALGPVAIAAGPIRCHAFLGIRCCLIRCHAFLWFLGQPKSKARQESPRAGSV